MGALIVRDRRVIATGYNGAPAGMPHCDDVGCDLSENGGCQRTVHAEANAITKVAKSNNSSEGSTLYITASPCLECAKLIIQAGIIRVVYSDSYRISDGIELLEKAKVEVVQINNMNDENSK